MNDILNAIPFIVAAVGTTALLAFGMWWLFGNSIRNTIFRLRAPKRFLEIFNVDFEKNPALKNALQEKVVDRTMTTLATALRNANHQMDELNREAKAQGDYKDFRKRYIQAQHGQKYALEKFDLAREVARSLGFKTQSYSEYTYFT